MRHELQFVGNVTKLEIVFFVTSDKVRIYLRINVLLKRLETIFRVKRLVKVKSGIDLNNKNCDVIYRDGAIDVSGPGPVVVRAAFKVRAGGGVLQVDAAAVQRLFTGVA